MVKNRQTSHLLVATVLLLLGGFPLASQQGAAGTADLVLLHGTVYTVSESMPRVEAVAVKGDRILSLIHI